MKKKLLSLLAAAALFGALAAPACAQPAQSSLTVNGQPIGLPQPPFIEQGQTMVPIRPIFEGLQAQVDYDAASRTITATRPGVTLALTLNGSLAYKNGESLPLDFPALEYQGTAFVPLRFVSEALGADVDWQEADQTILITLADRQLQLALGQDSHTLRLVITDGYYDGGGYANGGGLETYAEAKAFYERSGGRVVSKEEFDEAIKSGIGSGREAGTSNGTIYVLFD